MLFADRRELLAGRVRRARIAIAIAAVMWASAAWGADSTPPPPVVLPPFSVVESALKVKVLISYHRFRNSPPFVTRMTVDEVKAGSFAEQAGLKSGMEIIAIQGQEVIGLNQTEVERLLSQLGKDTILLRVRRSWRTPPEDMRILVRPP